MSIDRWFSRTQRPERSEYDDTKAGTVLPRNFSAYVLVQDHPRAERVTYMKIKNHFHSVRSRKAPKSKAPRYPPTGADAPKSPRLKFRTRPGGLVLDIIATALGMINAPPRPARARIVTKAKKLLQKAFARVQMVSQAPPASTSSRWP